MRGLLAVLLSLVVFGLAPVARAEDDAPSPFPEVIHGGGWASAIGLHVTAGLAFGGHKLAELTYSDGSTSSVAAGEGIVLVGGATWTPLWFGDRVGLGLGLDGGYKFKSTFSAADGSVNLERFPVTLTARGLIGLAKGWHVVTALGATMELKPKLRGEGVLSNLNADFKDAIGGVAELGILRGQPHGIGGEITGRFTYMKYAFGSESFDAMNGAVNFTLHYFL
jgi:hypothetical protein